MASSEGGVLLPWSRGSWWSWHRPSHGKEGPCITLKNQTLGAAERDGSTMEGPVRPRTVFTVFHWNSCEKQRRNNILDIKLLDSMSLSTRIAAVCSALHKAGSVLYIFFCAPLKRWHCLRITRMNENVKENPKSSCFLGRDWLCIA